MECLLVGGLGYLGVNLAKKLQQCNLDIRVLARRSSMVKHRNLYKIIQKYSKITVTGSDKITPKDIQQHSADCIVHLAGKHGGSYRKLYDAHVELTRRIIEAAEYNMSKIIYVSSIAVPADLAREPPGSTIVEEDHHLANYNSIEWSTYHSMTKAQGEKLTAQYKGKWLILRPGLIYGEHRYHLEWKLLGKITRLRIYPYIHTPITYAQTITSLILKFLNNEIHNTWINTIEKQQTMLNLQDEICHENQCKPINIEKILKIGKLLPKSSRIKLAWSIVRKNYIYSSKYRVESR